MDTKNEISVLVLNGNKADDEIITHMKFEENVSFKFVTNSNECLVDLQSNQYNVLIIDSKHLMLGEKMNSYYLRTVNELVPVIVISDNDKPEIESNIRAERIFYFLVKPIVDNELKSAIIQASKWNEAQKRKEAARHEQKFIPNVTRTLKACMMITFLFLSYSWAEGITVSITCFKNLTGNPCNDWIGSSFSNDLVTTVKNMPGVRVIEDAEMNKLLDAMKFSFSGMVDEKTAVEKGRVIGVKYSIIGSVQLLDDKAIACYRLVNMETGEIVFSNTLKGSLKNMLGLEDQLNKQVVISFETRFPWLCKVSASNKKNGFAIIHGDGSLGLKYSLMEDKDEALRCYKQAIEENPEFADGYLGIGDINMQNKEYAAAQDNFYKAYDLYDKYSDKYFLGRVSYNIGEACYLLEDYDGAVTYFSKALNYKKNTNDDFQLVYIYGRLSEISEIRSENDKAIEYIKKSIKISERLHDISSKIESMSKLAELYESKSDYKAASKISAKAYKLSDRMSYANKDRVAQLSAKLNNRLAMVSRRQAQISTVRE